VNQPLLLHVVERLEAFVGKLPGAIQKPILHELTPLKELFLQQRPPRLMIGGPSHLSPSDLLRRLFGYPFDQGGLSGLVPNRWNDISILDHGAVSVLDARGDDDEQIEIELQRQPPDVVLYFEDTEKRRKKDDKESLSTLAERVERLNKTGEEWFPFFVFSDAAQTKRGDKSSVGLSTRKRSSLRLNGTFDFEKLQDEPYRKQFITALARELPNAARIEMGRISNDKAVQSDIAHILVKSTTAICTAIGAQPIPLADLPILTTLQLVMVSGIMYVSGRERSLRAATEFLGALGANVGAGMLLREGTRAILKFFPGWGNIVCGAVAGAGTYAIGRAATSFFIEGVSLRDARRTYRLSRKKPIKQRPLGRKRALGLTKTNGKSDDE
jgi:uncharacterized protein (DUF697 family)